MHMLMILFYCLPVPNNSNTVCLMTFVSTKGLFTCVMTVDAAVTAHRVLVSVSLNFQTALIDVIEKCSR